VTDFLERTGAPVERLLERANLSPQLVEQPESLVPFLAVARFVDEAARVTGTEDFGLRTGTAAHPMPPGTFGRLARQGRTLHEMLEIAYRLWSLYNSSVQAWLTRSGDQVHLHHRFLHGSERDLHHYTAAVLMQYLNVLRAVAGPTWRPTAVGVPMRELPGWRSIPMLAETKITFGQPATTISLDASLLKRPLPWVSAIVTPTEVAELELTKPAADVGGAVRQVIAAMLPAGYPRIHLVADGLRMSARTLQRRLHDDGLTFGRVVDQARFESARRLLRDPSRKVIDVALDLGYSDPAHFTRAFARWAGQTPRDFRRHPEPGHSPAAR
jgi:AraC-like DNA-binding protein